MLLPVVGRVGLRPGLVTAADMHIATTGLMGGQKAAELLSMLDAGA
jgi:hypothetical protein